MEELRIMFRAKEEAESFVLKWAGENYTKASCETQPGTKGITALRGKQKVHEREIESQ
jgi:hypothetical protein